jgi:hypothetical protein
MKGSMEWRGVDGAGFLYGFYREGDRSWRMDIKIPGAEYGSGGAKPGEKFKVYVDGDLVSTEESAERGKATLQKFFAEGRHHKLEQQLSKRDWRDSESPPGFKDLVRKVFRGGEGKGRGR